MATENQVQSKPRIAIITGGSRGLGRNTAVAAAGHGIDVILTYHSNKAEADAAVAEVEAKGRKAVGLQLDTGAAAGFPAFVEAVQAALGETWNTDRFDYLVNNAGIGLNSPFGTTTEADLDRLYAVHFKGPYLLSQALLPLIRDGGRIVNLSSGLARFSLPGSAAYASMKGAVEVLTRYMARELGPRQIAVNVVAPGAIETDFGGGRVRDNADINRFVAGATAMGRAGLPDDIGPMIALLLSDENRWMTGQRLEVSGGMFL